MPRNAEALRGVKILIVEDEILIAEEIRDRLTRLGAQIVDVVDTGSAAREAAERLRPDLVLMDIRLKGAMTGIEAAEPIRRDLRIPVVFLTAHSDWETVLRAKRSDPFGYVLKPFQEEDLVTTVQVALHRHTLERQLAESERRFEATLSSIGEGVIAADAGGRVTFLNSVAETLTQWQLAEAEGRPIEEVFSLSVPRRIETASVNPALQALRQRKVVQTLGSVSLRARDGRSTPVDVSAAPIVLRTDERKVIGTVVAFRDISDRVRLEETLKGTAERYRLLADNSSDTIWVMGIDEKFTYASPAVLNLSGYTPEELVNLSMEQVLTPNSLRVARSIIAEITSVSGAQRIPNRIVELEVVCKDGSLVWTDVSVGAVRNAAGKLVALQGAARDITERKRA
jgi:PAS domain S-box-containing protein